MIEQSLVKDLLDHGGIESREACNLSCRWGATVGSSYALLARGGDGWYWCRREQRVEKG